ncbi:hypothetical protein D3C72_2337360 [compost metagenome]
MYDRRIQVEQQHRCAIDGEAHDMPGRSSHAGEDDEQHQCGDAQHSANTVRYCVYDLFLSTIGVRIRHILSPFTDGFLLLYLLQI